MKMPERFDNSRNPSSDAKAPHIERLGRAEVAPGQYWRCSSEHKGVALAGDVLLVADVRKDGENDHRVDLHAHPRYTRANERRTLQVLIDEFYDQWTYAPDGQQIRAREVQDLQRQTGVVQAEITRAQTDPAFLNQQVQKAIAAKAEAEGSTVTDLAHASGLDPQQLLAGELPSVNTYIEAGVTSQMLIDSKRILESAHQVTQARSDWFNGRVQQMGVLTQAMMPYLQEAAAVPLAMVKRDIQRANELLRSVETLGLFVGDGVSLLSVATGEPAAEGPVTLYQRKLYIDEEMAYFTQYASNTISSETPHRFVEALAASPELLDLFVPAQRGAVLVAFSRQHHWWSKDIHPVAAEFLAEQDKISWLLVRDGGNAWLVGSPCGTHQKADMLFPELDLDGTVFSGVDGKRITPESLRWTDRIDVLQATAIHYRRFAVVLSGLVSRDVTWKGVDAMQFLTAGTASRMVFIRDASGEGVLGSDELGALTPWLSHNRSTVRSGSTVILDLSTLGPRSAPAFYSTDGGGDPRLRVLSPTGCAELKVQREGQRLFVSVSAEHHFNSGSMINARVSLVDHGRSLATGWVCVDSVDPAQLDRILSHRDNRKGYVGTFPMLHAARARALELRAASEPLARWLTEQVATAGLATAAAATPFVNDAIAQHRASTGDLPPPQLPQATALLDLLFHRLKSVPNGIGISQIADACRALGAQPLRLVMAAKGDLILYATPAAPDNRVCDQIEVARWKVARARSAWALSPLAEKAMFVSVPDEAVLHEWQPDAEARSVTGVPKHTKRERLNAIETLESIAADRRRLLTGALDEQTYADLLAELQAIARPYIRKHGRMPSIDVVVPVCVASTTAGKLSMLAVMEPFESIIARNWQGPDVNAGAVLGETWIKLHAKPEYASRLASIANLARPLSGDAAHARLVRLPLGPITESARLQCETRPAGITRELYEVPMYDLSKASLWLGDKTKHAAHMSQWVWAPGWDTDSSDPLMKWLLSGAVAEPQNGAKQAQVHHE